MRLKEGFGQRSWLNLFLGVRTNRTVDVIGSSLSLPCPVQTHMLANQVTIAIGRIDISSA